MRNLYQEAPLADFKTLPLFSEGWELKKIWINVPRSWFDTKQLDHGFKYPRIIRNLQYQKGSRVDFVLSFVICWAARPTVLFYTIQLTVVSCDMSLWLMYQNHKLPWYCTNQIIVLIIKIGMIFHSMHKPTVSVEPAYTYIFCNLILNFLSF